MRLFGAFITAAVLMLLVAASTAAAPPKAPAWNAALYATPPTDNWMAVGGDVQQQHYSALTAINAGNVGRLAQSWTTHLDGSGVEPRNSQEATPLEYAGVLYIITGNDDVFALDATSGTHLWTYHANLPQEMTSVCCGWVSRGLGMGDGKIFVSQLDGNVVALDQSTGAVVWKTANMRWQDGSGMTSAPLYYKGLVYVGSTGGEFDIRGSITAYDATTGMRVWRFFTIPQPGEIGSGSWPQNDEWKTGGATVWDSPSVDPTTGTMYFTTSNPSPTGARAKGDDLFSSSILALDAMTGTYRWHFQMVHHDIWDFDCPSPTVVFDATYGGTLHHGVAEACKTGWLYEFDRSNGQPLIPGGIVEQPVDQAPNGTTSSTQPFPQGDAVVPHCAQPIDFPSLAPDGKPFKFGCIFGGYDTTQYVAQAPGGPGGVNWPPVSWNPQTNMIYVCAIVTEAAKISAPVPFVPGRTITSARTANAIYPYHYGYGGTFTALNVATDKIAWQIKTPPGEPCYSGSLSTAGNLVLWGHNNGDFEADDAASGKTLWKISLPNGADAPAIAYAVHGKEYVAILDGGSWFTNDRGAKNAHGDSVYAFALP